MLSRRELLTTGTTTLLTVGLAPSALAAGGVNNDLSRSFFLSKLKKRFVVFTGFGWFRVELFDVVDGPDDPQLEQFTAVFRSITGVRLPESAYYMWDGSQICRLLLQPVRTGRGGATYYAAAFAHLL